MRNHILTTIGLAAAVALAPVAAPASAGQSDTAAQLGQVRQATAKYHDLDTAVADGYQQASPCVPQMGFHYLKSVAADESQLDPTAPNILVYAPLSNGGLRLVAVEYASWAPATLFGRAFDPPHEDGPPFHTLHAWVWQGNPGGMFTAQNPNVSCDV
jgi:hypothetical protein